MGTHPINLAIRFLLELLALGALGTWGWKQSDNWTRFVFAVLIPVLFAAIWGTFAVPDDPSRSGNAPIVTPGWIRLIIEFIFFASATWAMYDMGWVKFSLIVGVIVLVHYAFSYDRIIWLMSQ